MKLVQQHILTWLETVEPNKRFHFKEALFGEVKKEDYGTLRKIFHDLKESRVVKPSGYRDGYYSKIVPVKSIRKWGDNEADVYDLRWPQTHQQGENPSELEYEGFPFEDLIQVSPGDLVVIAGVSNAGKSALANNILGENLNKECVLMGNEFANADEEVTSKFKRRLQRMSWAEWTNGDGEFNFSLIPAVSDFEDYIQKDKLNIIDWIMLGDKFWEIAELHFRMKSRIGKGLIVAVQQKTRGKEFADGGEWSERLADVYFSIDFHGKGESRLTVGKVKEPKAQVTGRSWAFSIVDYGANLHNIREVRKCWNCYGKGYTKQGDCPECHSLGWKDKSYTEVL